MKLALLGYGKMGKMVEQAALARGHQIVLIHNKTNAKPIDLSEADLCIDFSHPDCVLTHIKLAADYKKNIIVGTTGWDQSFPVVDQLVKKAGIGLLYAPNFSIGVHLFLKVVAEAAKLISQFNDYDVALLESHHRKKVDSPSGTAKALVNVLLKEMKNKKQDQLQVASLRCGSIPGNHSIIFDSAVDTITLSHEARSREGFASGAVLAAEWLLGKKGLFSLEDLLTNEGQ